MSVKAEFEKLDAELHALHEEQNSLYTKIAELERKRENLLGSYLLEESILNQYPWYITGETRWAKLECSKRSSEWKTLAGLAETNYHCWSDLGDGTSLCFDDGDITISFKDLSKMAAFIKKHKLKIAKSSIANKYNELQKSLKEIEPFYDMIHGDYNE